MNLTYVKLKNINIRFYFCSYFCILSTVFKTNGSILLVFSVFVIIDTKSQNTHCVIATSCGQQVNMIDWNFVKVRSRTFQFECSHIRLSNTA